jgi:hypothetical protein
MQYNRFVFKEVDGLPREQGRAVRSVHAPDAAAPA